MSIHIIVPNIDEAHIEGTASGCPFPPDQKDRRHDPSPDARLDRSLPRRRPTVAAGGQEEARRGAKHVPAAKGALEAPTRERIALAVAEVNGCDYCLSAHSYLGKNLAKLSDVEIAANRNGGSGDAKADAAVGFAVKLVKARGHVTDADIKAVKDAGYNDAQLIEIVLHVALNTLTNYVNEVAKTEIDFPVVTAKAA